MKKLYWITLAGEDHTSFEMDLDEKEFLVVERLIGFANDNLGGYAPTMSIEELIEYNGKKYTRSEIKCFELEYIG